MVDPAWPLAFMSQLYKNKTVEVNMSIVILKAETVDIGGRIMNLKISEGLRTQRRAQTRFGQITEELSSRSRAVAVMQHRSHKLQQGTNCRATKKLTKKQTRQETDS